MIQGGGVIWHGGYGFADRQRSRPVTDRTLFNIGSVSKVVAAWGVMAMARDAGIDLDTPVQRYLTRWRIPASDFDAEAVTLRRLLSHTSGLSVFPVSESFTYPPSPEETLSQSYGTFGRLRLVREPGSTFEYNNGNYIILQLLVEEVTDSGFASYMYRRVLEPLQMKLSTYVLKRDQVAIPYDQSDGALPYYATYENESFAASGGLFTTASDLAAFVAAAMPGPDRAPPGRGVLTPETVRLMIAPAPETRGRYGLGYEMLPVSDTLTMIGHNGANPGWRAAFMAVPTKGAGIAVLTNSEVGGRIIADIVCTWADWDTEIELTGLCKGARPIPAR